MGNAAWVKYGVSGGMGGDATRPGREWEFPGLWEWGGWMGGWLAR